MYKRQSLLRVSPFHGSMIVTDLGSLGIPPIYHHLYNFGNLPVFLAFGAKRRVVELDRHGRAVEHKYVEEGGGMNVVFKINGRIITPMLTGSILPGVTRRSCLQLFEDWGMPVEERLISVDELFEAAANGTLEEAMCVGTAAVICPIGELTYEGKAYTINNFQTGPLAQKLYDTLTGIQWGTQPDPHGLSLIHI